MKPISNAKASVSLTKLPSIANPPRTSPKQSASVDRRSGHRGTTSFSTPPMKSQKWMSAVTKSHSSDSIFPLVDDQSHLSESLSHRIRLPPLEGLEGKLLPPTQPAKLPVKIPRLHKRFDNMDETLMRIPCEDFMSALLNREPCFDNALIQNWEKFREKCKCDDAVTEYVEEEDLTDSPYVNLRNIQETNFKF